MSIADKTLVTAEELLDLASDGLRHELIQGELITMPPSGSEHGRVASRIDRILGVFVEENDLGETLAAETGFILAKDPDTVRAPDFAFVRKDRVAGGVLPKGFFPGPPDLAVEVLSPNDRAIEVEEKIHEWLEAGTRQVWVVNLQRRTLTVHETDRPPRVLQTSDVLEGGDLLPGFRRTVGDLLPKPL